MKKYNRCNIWRVEDENGQGCYAIHDADLDDLYEAHAQDFINHPLPLSDKGIEREIFEEEICGFLNKKQAIKWFSKKDLKILLEYGFELKKVKIKEITAIGEKQVLAIR